MKANKGFWKHRRKMAYFAFYHLPFLLVMLFFVAPETIIAMQSIIITYFTTMGGVVATYFGFATYHDVKLEATPLEPDNPDINIDK